MKEAKAKKQVGIWIDQEQAIIVEIVSGQERVIRVRSEVEGGFRPHGGSRSRTPYGPQDASDDKKSTKRRQHQLVRFFDEIRDEIGEAHRVLIFGPGETKIQFHKELEKHPGMVAKIAGVEPADKMTNGQVVAKVRDFFGSHRG